MNVTGSFEHYRLEAGFTVADVVNEFGVSNKDVRIWDEGKATAPAHIIRSLEVIGRYQSKQSSIKQQDKPDSQRSGREIHCGSPAAQSAKKQSKMNQSHAKSS